MAKKKFSINFDSIRVGDRFLLVNGTEVQRLPGDSDNFISGRAYDQHGIYSLSSHKNVLFAHAAFFASFNIVGRIPYAPIQVKPPRKRVTVGTKGQVYYGANHIGTVTAYAGNLFLRFNAAGEELLGVSYLSNYSNMKSLKTSLRSRIQTRLTHFQRMLKTFS